VGRASVLRRWRWTPGRRRWQAGSATAKHATGELAGRGFRVLVVSVRGAARRDATRPYGELETHCLLCASGGQYPAGLCGGSCLRCEQRDAVGAGNSYFRTKSGTRSKTNDWTAGLSSLR
jgi:hypothetical protein